MKIKKNEQKGLNHKFFAAFGLASQIESLRELNLAANDNFEIFQQAVWGGKVSAAPSSAKAETAAVTFLLAYAPTNIFS